MKRIFLFVVLMFHVLLTLFANEIYNDYIIELDEKNYYLVAYFDTLYKSDRDVLKTIFPKSNLFKDTVWDEADGNIIHKWYEENFFPFEKIQLVKTLSNTVSDNRLMLGKGIIIDIKSLQQENNKTTISFQEKHYGEEDDWYFWSFLDWSILRKSNSNTLIFIEDGDYLKVYYDEDKMYPFAKYARMNKETFEQFKNLIYYNTCDLSRVTWPRHADGTCDYDDEIKPPMTQLSDNDSVSEEEENATPSDLISEDEEGVEKVEENVPVVKNASSLSLVIIVVSAAILLMCIVIILVVRKKKRQ